MYHSTFSISGKEKEFRGKQKHGFLRKKQSRMSLGPTASFYKWVGWVPERISGYPRVQFSHSVVSDSLRPHGLQHAWLPCPSPTPGAYSNSCPLSQWCHLTFSASVIPFSSHHQSFPASGSFPMSQFFTSDGQNIGVSASASVLPVTIQELGWAGWISLQSKGLSRVFSNTTFQKHQFFGAQLSL